MSFQERATRWAIGKSFLPVSIVALVLSTCTYLIALVSPAPQLYAFPSFFLLFFPTFWLCVISLSLHTSPPVNLRDGFFSQLRAAPLRSVLVSLIASAMLAYTVVAWVNCLPPGQPEESNGHFLVVYTRSHIIKAELTAPEFQIYKLHYYHTWADAFLSSAVFFSYMAIILKITATKDPFALPEWTNRN